MYYKRRNVLLMCLFTSVGIWTLISSAGVSFKKYHPDPSLARYRCGPTDIAFEDDVFGLARCGWLCHVDNMCRRFLYLPDSYKCIGCRVDYGIKTCDEETYPGSKYFRSMPMHVLDTDCKQIFENRCSPPSGLYDIRLWKSEEILTVFCDMDTDGGGWTVFQNRFNGSVDFAQNFTEYDNGFGKIDGEFWLGLKYIQELANQGSTDIRLDITRANNEKYFQKYKDFKLLHGTDYNLSFEAGPAEGTPGLGDGLNEDFNYHNGKRFSTLDRDMDDNPQSDFCTRTNRGGWWYGSCGSVFLNGNYCTPGTERTEPDDACLTFKGISELESLKATRMSIRRVGKDLKLLD